MEVGSRGPGLKIPLVSGKENGYKRTAHAKLGTLPEETTMATAGQGHTAVREVMDIRQAADYLGISGDTLYRYASEGFIPAFKLGNRWRFRKSLMDAWMDEKSGVRAQHPAEPVDVTKKKPTGRAR
jgi:excisionase family DNA binding protein